MNVDARHPRISRKARILQSREKRIADGLEARRWHARIVNGVLRITPPNRRRVILAWLRREIARLEKEAATCS